MNPEPAHATPDSRALPEPLAFVDGGRVASPADWPRRRTEILELFRSHVYGRAPVGRPADLSFKITEAREAFSGSALRRELEVRYGGPGGEGAFPVTLFQPKGRAPLGCFVLIVNRSKRIITAAESGPDDFWPVETILSRGYATAAFHHGDVAADDAARAFETGVFRVFGPASDARAPDSWGAVAAWAWGASRVLDFLETDPVLGPVPFVVVGHSRGGKSALWCGAQDERVALCISNNSGSTGAALARATRGESVGRITGAFPHWFAPAYREHAADPRTLPVDQHLLLGLIAPRAVYVASASEDSHADPRAEFAAAHAAAEIFRYLGKRGVEPDDFPAPGESRAGGDIGYHLRPGRHDLQAYDWDRFLDFADLRLARPTSR
jgi:hypothetical protein